MIDLSLAQRREFMKNYEDLVDLFGQDLVDSGLMRYTMTELCDVYQIPLQDAYGRPAANVPSAPYQKPHISLGIKDTYYRFVNHQGWEKLAPATVTEWQVPAQYQHNAQVRRIVQPALLTLYPWLSSFKLAIYTLMFYDNNPGEFYVKLGCSYWKGGFDCLYVPIKSFMDGDVEAIVKRNQSYFDDYTKDKSVWLRMKLDPTVIRFLELVKENAK